MLANLTGALSSDGFVPIKLADKRGAVFLLDMEHQKLGNTTDEPVLSEPVLGAETVPILAADNHPHFLIERRPKATGPPSA